MSTTTTGQFVYESVVSVGGGGDKIVVSRRILFTTTAVLVLGMLL